MFGENDPQIMVNSQSSFSAHPAYEGVIAQRGMEGLVLKKLDHMDYRSLVNR